MIRIGHDSLPRLLKIPVVWIVKLLFQFLHDLQITEQLKLNNLDSGAPLKTHPLIFDRVKVKEGIPLAPA